MGLQRWKTDLRDPMGRLGPHLQSGDPDLRNLKLYFEEFQEGDVLLLLNQTAWMNYIPEISGKIPRDFNLNAVTWEQAREEYPDEVPKIYQSQLQDLLTQQFRTCVKDNILQLEDVKNVIESYVCDVPSAMNEFMEKNPRKKNPKELPGYLGNAIIFLLRPSFLETNRRL
eukprot:TRINITY_DN8192_c0_g1_i1.p1 TRINITY_DN8192_c0_g1~~TRINITY_DN8192_c0_g1_i1.p1  ORF type:complete len:170 (-),score=61.90 TRINITY_DN8192_c0_g1_i1:44-553(-)